MKSVILILLIPAVLWSCNSSADRSGITHPACDTNAIVKSYLLRHHLIDSGKLTLVSDVDAIGVDTILNRGLQGMNFQTDTDKRSLLRVDKIEHYEPLLKSWVNNFQQKYPHGKNWAFLLKASEVAQLMALSPDYLQVLFAKEGLDDASLEHLVIRGIRVPTTVTAPTPIYINGTDAMQHCLPCPPCVVDENPLQIPYVEQ